MFKKIIAISILIGSIILTGCSQKGELSKNELFSKKQECANYVDIISQRMKEHNEGNGKSILSLEEVFYSQKLNSCFYVDYMEDPDINTIKRLMTISSNVDGGPYKDISCKYNYYNEKGFLLKGDCQIFDQKIQELKGE